MFNIIIDSPPEKFGGVPLNTDFKQGLKFYRVLGNKEFTDETKSQLIFNCFFKGIPQTNEDQQNIFPFIEWFVSGGSEKDEEEEEGKPKTKKVFDFNADHGRIYGAFLQVYGIDLTKASMHWWTFLSLFDSLPEGTKLNQIIELRGKEVPKSGDKKYIRKLRALKKAFEIDPEGDKREQEAKINDWASRW